MSLVKTGAVQVGQSATASNNFHWRNLLDGVLRLTRGNVGTPIADVMLVNADNSISFPGNVASGVLGAGQTWQAVTRNSGVTYTNTTGKPIQWTFLMNGSTTITVVVNGFTLWGGPLSSAASVFQLPCLIIPIGATYSVTVTAGSTLYHAELR